MPSPQGAPAGDTPRVAVVIVNHDGRRFLETCLTSVYEQSVEGGFEVVLVDNASRDGSPGYVRETFPEVRLLELAVNQGFAGGNNAGIGSTAAPLVVLLNNDVRVRAGWLAALVAAADAEPAAGAVTSKLVFMDRPDVIQNAGSLLLSDGSGGDRGAGETDRGQYDRREEVFAACGNGVLLRRAMLEDVGLLDETFFAYYEDTDLSWRMRLRGWTVVYEPRAVVEHAHAATSVERSPFFVFHANRNRVFMLLKNAPAGMVATSLASYASRLLARRRPAPVTAAPGGAGPGGAGTHARVFLSLLAHLPEMLAKRRRIRSRRQVDDSAILTWLYPRALWDSRPAS